MRAQAHNLILTHHQDLKSIKMENIIDNVENATIRVDTATQKGSVFDVIKMVLGCDASSANTAFRRLKEDFPESGAGAGAAWPTLTKLRINGKGQLTPVADAKTLVEIVFLLPGRIARDFRRKSAAKVCRLLGGDSTLISEIEQRRAQLQSSAEGQASQAFLLGGSSSGSVGESQRSSEVEMYHGMPTGFRFLDDSQRQLVAKEVVDMTLKRKRVEDLVERYKMLRDIGVELDDRTKIEIRDNVSLLTKRDLAIQGSSEVTQDSKTPTHMLGAQERGAETGIVVVAAKMGVRVPPVMSGPIGKLMKTLYKKKYDLPADWDGFIKRQTLYHGRPIQENCYYERDEDIVMEAIRTKISQ